MAHYGHIPTWIMASYIIVFLLSCVFLEILSSTASRRTEKLGTICFNSKKKPDTFLEKRYTASMVLNYVTATIFEIYDNGTVFEMLQIFFAYCITYIKNILFQYHTGLLQGLRAWPLVSLTVQV